MRKKWFGHIQRMGDERTQKKARFENERKIIKRWTLGTDGKIKSGEIYKNVDMTG